MRARRAIAIAALSFAVAGCAENAILELDIIPPDGATGVLHVQPLSTDMEQEFGTATAQGLGTAIEVPLGVADEPPHVSLVADGVEIERGLYVGVGICPEDEICFPSRVFHVERAFYLGRFTHLDIDLRDGLQGTEIERVSTCRVQGCGRSESNYCYEDSNGEARHFCDR